MTSCPFNHAHMVTVTVTDQDAAIDFWTEKLGFELRVDVPFGEGHRWVEVAPPSGQTVLALQPQMAPQQPPPGQHTGISFDTSDIQAAHATMSERGVDVDEVQHMGAPVPPLANFRDNDGNHFMMAQVG